MPPNAAPTRLVVLLFSDIVGSVQLKSRLGDAAAARIIARHDAIFRRVFEEAGDGEILKDTGDGFLARFNTVSSSVNFALLFQDAMRREPWSGSPLLVRVGLHLGEVSELEPDPEGGAKLSGLAIDLTARVMGLAEGGQILLTRALFDSARQYVRQHPVTSDGRTLTIRWMAHGPYKFKGTDEPLEVFEVGAEGEAPLRAPRDSEKAHRALAPGEDETLGWRPAIGLDVPTRGGWKLERRIGEGGFGEVWLGVHEKTRVHRAFKFCFDQDRLRSLKRELTLFRVLREVLGDRDDIARLYEVQLEEAPYFLEVEFTEAGDLKNWATAQGGIDKVPIATRLDLVARIARAVAAAHSVGVLHKDIKPANILIHQIKGGEPRPRLSDFGIGMLADRTELDARQITMSGFTGLLTENESSRTGTRLYAPPESLIGKAFTVQGDIYALGVLLYQMIVGDLERPLAVGWERDVDDPLLREDISLCVEGDPDRRLRTAAELADRLETLPQRRKQRGAELQRIEQVARRQRLARLTVAALVVVTVLLGMAGVAYFRERDLRRTAQIEADKSRRMTGYLQNMFKQARVNELGRHARIVQVLDPAVLDIDRSLGQDPEIAGAMKYTFGSLYTYIGDYESARPLLEQSLETLRKVDGPDARTTLLAMNGLGLWHLAREETDAADPLLTNAYQKQNETYGPRDIQTLEFANDLARLRVLQERFEESFKLFRETIAAHKEREGGFGSETVIVTNNYADALTISGAIAEAEKELKTSLDEAQTRWGDDSVITISAANNYGAWLIRQRQFKQAVALMEPLLGKARDVLGRYHPDAAWFAANLAAAYVELDDDRAGPLLDDLVDDVGDRIGRDYPAIQFACFSRINWLMAQGRSDDLVEAFGQLIADRSALYGPDSVETLRVQQQFAPLLDKLGKADEAEAMFLRVVATLEKGAGADHPETLFAKNNAAGFYWDHQRFDEALPLYQQAATGADQVLEGDDWRRWFLHARYGRCLRATGKLTQAEEELKTACAALERLVGIEDAKARDAFGELIKCYEQMSRPEDAEAYRKKLAPDQ